AVAVAAVLGQQGDADVEGPRPRVGPVVDGDVADVAGQGAVLQLDQQVAAVLAEQPVPLEPAPQLPVGGEPEPVVAALRLPVGRAWRPSSLAICISRPTPGRSTVTNGLAGTSLRSSYRPRNLPMSSRENPKAVWVRSLVPKEKNSATSAISPATRAARGSSIM